MSLDTLLSGLRQRREEAAANARAAYRALVRRLAAEGPTREDSPEAVARVLEAAGVNEKRLAQDVARVEAFRRAVERARRLPEAKAAHEEAMAAAAQAHERCEAETRRLRAEVDRARGRVIETQRALELAQEAFESALPGAPARLRARYESARRDLDVILSRIALARSDDAPYRTHDPAVLRHVETEFAALREAERELRAHDDRTGRPANVDQDASQEQVRRQLAAKVTEAREAFRLALLRVADEAETHDVPRAREELAAATAALLDAEFVLDPEEDVDDLDDEAEGGLDEDDGEDLDDDEDDEEGEGA